MVRCLFLVGALLLSTGCLFVDVTSPLDTNLDRTELGSKVGMSSIQSVLGVVAWGDAGTQAAAEQGGLKVINHADQKILLIMGGLYYKHTTIVYGE